MNKIEILITGNASSGKSYFTRFVQEEFPRFSRDKVSIKASLDEKINANRIVIKRLKKPKEMNSYTELEWALERINQTLLNYNFTTSTSSNQGMVRTCLSVLRDLKPLHHELKEVK